MSSFSLYEKYIMEHESRPEVQGGFGNLFFYYRLFISWKSADNAKMVNI